MAAKLTPLGQLSQRRIAQQIEKMAYVLKIAGRGATLRFRPSLTTTLHSLEHGCTAA